MERWKIGVLGSIVNLFLLLSIFLAPATANDEFLIIC